MPDLEDIPSGAQKEDTAPETKEESEEEDLVESDLGELVVSLCGCCSRFCVGTVYLITCCKQVIIGNMGSLTSPLAYL